VVYSHLNPWLVNFHMLVSLAMVVLGAVQYHRSKYLYGPDARVELRSPRLLFIARWLAVNLIIVLVVGTATTGSGPHAGNSVGQDVARRLPFALINVAWVHSLVALVFFATVLGLFLYLYQSNAAPKLQMGLRRLLIIGSLQGVIGFVQYALHLPVWLVELHIILATSLTIGVTQFNLSQWGRDREMGINPSRT
jgi:cytochrome c oxidase assembly protein subunit 15